MSEWWRGAVIYQIYPRSFQDSNGDGVGDLKGVTRRLDHAAGLGADAVWLSPFFTSPMADMGYDVSDYKAVDPVFGSLADFDGLVRKAHDLELKLIIDQVISHSSIAHDWFQESRLSRHNDKADWYVWAEGNEDGTPPNNWLSVFGGPAWEWDTRRRQYYLHNFLSQQPDLNFHNPQVQDAVLDVMRFWLERGVDGFRLDTANFYFHDRFLRNNPHAPRTVAGKPNPAEINPYQMQEQVYSKSRPETLKFLERLRGLLDEYEATTSVGEIGDDDRAIELMAQYTAGEKRLHMAYSFDMLGPEFTPAHFRARIDAFFAGAPDGWPCWSFSNHDVERHVSRWLAHGAGQDALARLAAAMLLSFEGSVCLYEGEELGLTDTALDYGELTDPRGLRFWPEDKGRDGCRTPMVWDESESGGFTTGTPWLPVKAPQLERNVAAQDADEQSVLNFYRRMLALRKAHPALVAGRTRFFDAGEAVLAFGRAGGGEDIVCLFNLTPEPVRLQVAGLNAGLMSEGVAVDGASLDLAPNGFGLFAAGPDADVRPVAGELPSSSAFDFIS